MDLRQAGVALSFKDVLKNRKQEPPILEVCDPQIKSSTASKHHVYKLRGTDS